ncbi:hypothetical protein BU15DRAFT_78733 [Melanogaster broomeanus]|nr:hypothetical protein BU15DRAFT_78733 [Melanogaster broomeanus]
MDLTLLPPDLNPTSIAASMGCTVPASSNATPSSAPSSMSPSSVLPSTLPSPKTSSSSGVALLSAAQSSSWPSTTTSATSSPRTSSSDLSLTPSVTPPATSKDSRETTPLHQVSKAAASTPSLGTTSGGGPSGTPAPLSGAILTTLTSSSSGVVPTQPTSPLVHHVPGTIISAPSSTIVIPSPLSDTTSSSISQSTIVTASIGGTVGLVTLLGALILIYLRCRPRKPVMTPYSYATIPASPRRPSPSTRPEIKFGLDSHIPSTSISTNASAQSQNTRFSLAVTLSDTVRDENATLCVPEDKSIAARRQRERELEKLYPVRPPRASGEYGVGSANSSVESLSVYSYPRGSPV